MPVLYTDSNSNYTTDDILESADDELESREIEYGKPVKGGMLFITIGGSGTFEVQVKLGDGLDNYGPYHKLADADGNTTLAVAAHNFDMAIQEFWGQGIKQLMFKVVRLTGTGDVPITDAVFNHVY